MPQTSLDLTTEKKHEGDLRTYHRFCRCQVVEFCEGQMISTQGGVLPDVYVFNLNKECRLLAQSL